MTHGEFNPSEKDATHLLLIWIRPDRPACARAAAWSDERKWKLTGPTDAQVLVFDLA